MKTLEELKELTTCELLGEILAGLQVPLTLHILGAADEPYREFLRRTPSGWKSPEEFAVFIREALGVRD